MADVDPALEQQVFHVPQTQREADVHHDHQITSGDELK
jgi:hypothetical protein